MPACSAYGCKQRDRSDFVTFHRFPKNEFMRKKWIEATCRKDFNPSRTAVLCSRHFTEEDFDRTTPYYIRIREGVVPTVFEGLPKYLQKKKMKPRKAPASHVDHNVYADMDDALKMNETIVKEEITFKEEVLEESDVSIDPAIFSVPAGRVEVKRERKSSEETETATEGETPTYSSEEDWVIHLAGRRPQSWENIDQKASADPKEDKSPGKCFQSLEGSSRKEKRYHEGDTSDPLDCGLPESEEEIILKKDIELKKKEIEMRKKVLEMVQNVEPGDESGDKEDSAIIELLKSDLHIAFEKLELLLQERTFLFNSKRINHLELKLKDEEMKMREEEHQMKLKLYDIKKAYMFESSQMNGSFV